MGKAVAYARFSSFGQREESIEGQLREIREYAGENGLSLLGEYVDEAVSATSDNRASFQRMVLDSASGDFDTVLVYQFDRFARNRFDSALYKKKLRENGVRVVSVKENVPDDPTGIMLEGVLETVAEYYSADLSMKVRRGQQLNASECKYNGGTVPWGYRVGDDRRFGIDPELAPIVRSVFERYAEGDSIKDIADGLNAAGVKTCKGTPFTKSSLQRVLRNERYRGTYIYGSVRTPGGMPAIVDDALFETVQAKLERNKHHRGVTGDYLLTTKLFCGDCANMMVGVSGTSKTGAVHHYYSCKGARAGVCRRRSIRRDAVEDAVVSECLKVLTDENISRIAKAMHELCEKEAESPYLAQLKKERRAAYAAVENLTEALELGKEPEFLLDRISQRRAEIEQIDEKIRHEENAVIRLGESEVRFFFNDLRRGAIDSPRYRKTLVNILVNKVYVVDDLLTIFFNISNRPVAVTAEFAAKVSSGPPSGFLRGDKRSASQNDASPEFSQLGGRLFSKHCKWLHLRYRKMGERISIKLAFVRARSSD